MDIGLFEFSSISVKSQRNFAQTKTAMLSWYVQNSIVIGKLFTRTIQQSGVYILWHILYKCTSARRFHPSVGSFTWVPPICSAQGVYSFTFSSPQCHWCPTSIQIPCIMQPHCWNMKCWCKTHSTFKILVIKFKNKANLRDLKAATGL